MSCTVNQRLTIFLLLFLSTTAQAQLLVSDRVSNQITVHDPDTGEFQRVLVPGDPDMNGGMIAPSAMIEGPGGELLVASQFTGSVLRYNIDTGEFLGVFADQINVPSGLFYDQPTNRVFVSTFGNFDAELVMTFDGTTREAGTVIGEGTGTTGRSGVAIGPDGNLYVTSFADPMFFFGSVLQFDGTTFAANGPFAGLVPMAQDDPFLAGASAIEFNTGANDDLRLDVVGLFSNNVARFGLAETDDGLQLTSAGVLIAEGLDFPNGLLHLNDGSMLVTNLGNDNPDTGDLRSGSVARFNAETGEFIDTFIPAGSGNISQPTALLMLSNPLDCNGDGVVDQQDVDCGCAAGLDDILAELDLLAGDFNTDGNVDVDDFLTLSRNFNQEGGYRDGDANCSGSIDVQDFLVLSRNFGQSATAATVPEPTGSALVALTFLALLAVRRRMQ